MYISDKRVPPDGSVTEAMLSFNPATQVELDTAIGTRLTEAQGDARYAREQVDIYTPGSYTWTKPTWAKTVQAILIGGGAGGGSGRRGAAATVRCGGGGGGRWYTLRLDASMVGALPEEKFRPFIQFFDAANVSLGFHEGLNSPLTDAWRTNILHVWAPTGATQFQPRIITVGHTTAGRVVYLERVAVHEGLSSLWVDDPNFITTARATQVSLDTVQLAAPARAYRPASVVYIGDICNCSWWSV